MFIVNMDEVLGFKTFSCGKLLADWLIYEKNVPLLGNSKDGKFLFAKTELLLEVLSEMPFYIKLIGKLW